jgi:Uma2 family endonuclease
MKSLAEQPYYTPEEYLSLERSADFKSQYIDGQIYPMAGATREHIIITGNIVRLLGNQLRGKPCETYANEMKVGTEFSRLYSYPDVVIVCGEPRFHDEQHDVLINPNVIIEVLSDSTEAFDRGKKFARHQRIESFTDYILVAQDEPRLEHFIKQAENDWRLTVVIGLENSLRIESIDCMLSLSEVYERIAFSE